jgi:hypothetical protein
MTIARLDTPVEDGLLASVASELHREVSLRWAAYYPARATGEPPTITLTPRRCGFSAIYNVELRFATGRERLIVKIRREHKHGSFLRSALSEATLAASRAEYDEHVKAYRFFSVNGDGLGVVRPVDYLDAHNALVVEHAIGTDLSKLVRADNPIAADAIRRCGVWWQRFHYELHGAKHHAWNAAAFDAQLERRLNRLKAFGVPSELLNGLGHEIRATASKQPPVGVPTSLVHGDCKLRHVWATDDGIQVLDFGNAKSGVSWRDPAALVVELCLYSLWTRRLDAAPRVADIRTLLHAYFDGPPPPAFSLYVIDCLLKKWHRRLRNWGPGAAMGRLRQSLRVARLEKPLERLYIDRWFTTQTRAWLALANGHPPTWLEKVNG